MAEEDEEEGLGYLNTLVSCLLTIKSRARREPHLLRLSRSCVYYLRMKVCSVVHKQTPNANIYYDGTL